MEPRINACEKSYEAAKVLTGFAKYLAKSPIE
jgi:hypothetical protein